MHPGTGNAFRHAVRHDDNIVLAVARPVVRIYANSYLCVAQSRLVRFIRYPHCQTPVLWRGVPLMLVAATRHDEPVVFFVERVSLDLAQPAQPAALLADVAAARLQLV